MDDEQIRQEMKIETDYQEVKEWEESKSNDDFNTWKLKKLINERFILGIIVSVLMTLGIIGLLNG